MRRIGILGGMMDPIHRGHIAMAQAALNAGLSQVLLVPCQSPAHRPAAAASFADRCAMCRLAAGDSLALTVSDVESHAGVSYAVDTVRLLRQQYPDCAFTWILGADKLPSLAKWHAAQELFTLCDFFVCPRPGYDTHLSVPGASLRVLPLAEQRISSGEAVACLQRLEDAPALLPHAVARYIAAHGLYQKDYIPVLRRYGMSDARLTHTLGVRQTAIRLAERYGASMQAASVAAVLHDLAKPLPLSDMQSFCHRYALQLPDELLGDANLLHGPLAAAIAERELGVTHKGVLSAIACHTTGKAGMTALDMIIYLADVIEPSRRNFPGLEEIRTLAQTDLSGAVLLSMQRTRTYVLSRGLHFCTQTEAAMRELAQIKEVSGNG